MAQLLPFTTARRLARPLRHCLTARHARHLQRGREIRSTACVAAPEQQVRKAAGAGKATAAGQADSESGETQEASYALHCVSAYALIEY